jgi:hypothetical protein
MKAVTVVVGILVTLLGALAVALVSGILATFSPPLVVTAFAIVLSAVLLYCIAVIVLRTVRSAARLEGTTLAVVGPFRTRRCDLSAAEVSLDSTVVRDVGRGLVAVPFLLAEAPGSGVRVRLRLRTMRGQLLPPDQLDAIAMAIEAGARPEPAATRSGQVAASLRQLVTGAMARPS